MGDAHSTAAIGVAQRVLEQVREELMQPIAVGEERCGITRDELEGQACRRVAFAKDRDRLFEQRREIDALLRVGECACIGAREP
jgi:hypothetical protein